MRKLSFREAYICWEVGPGECKVKSCIWVVITCTISKSWGEGMNGLSTALLKSTLGYWWMASWTWVSNVPSQSRKPTISWAASKELWSAGRGRWSCPSSLHWRDLICSTASRCRVLSIVQYCSIQGTEHLRQEDRLRAGAVQAGEEKGRFPGDLIMTFRYLNGDCKKERYRHFSRIYCDRTRGNGFKLKREI